jgi:hypothetical protein
MRMRETVKKAHEKAVADQLQKSLSLGAAFEREGNADKREADVIYQLGDKSIAIEVATAYYTAATRRMSQS